MEIELNKKCKIDITDAIENTFIVADSNSTIISLDEFFHPIDVIYVKKHQRIKFTHDSYQSNELKENNLFPLKIKLGGFLKIVGMKITILPIISKSRKIKVNINFFIYNDSSPLFIKESINILNERFSVANIVFFPQIFYRQKIKNIYFFSNCKDQKKFPITSKQIINHKLLPLICQKKLKSINVHYIDHLFFDSLEKQTIKACSIPDCLTLIPEISNNIFLSSKSSVFSLSHEASHILLDTIHYKNKVIPSENLLYEKAQASSFLLIKNARQYSKINNLHPSCQINQIEKCREKAMELI